MALSPEGFEMRLVLVLAIALLVLGCSGEEAAEPQKTPTAGESTPAPQSLSGERLFEQKCSCHYSYYRNPEGSPGWLGVWKSEYYGNPAEKWSAGIDLMVEKRFTSVTDEEKLIIAEYLAERFAK